MPKILIEWDDYPEPVVDSVLNGLARMATLPEDASDASVRAASMLTGIGSAYAPEGVREILPFVRQILSGARDWRVRMFLARWLPNEEGAADEIASLLETIAAEDPPTNPMSHEAPAYAAVLGLARLGAAGESALRRLHASETVVHPQARALLNELAENGFNGGS